MVTAEPADSLADQVVRHLIDHIRAHRLPWGAAVPSEIRLSTDLKVSRGIVREAYRSLKTAGVLDIANGRSPRVGRLSNRAFMHFLQHAIATEQASEDQVFDVRSSLEVRAAEVAAKTRTAEHVDQLRQAAARMSAAGDRRVPFVKADIRFHEVIATATGNPLFSLLGSALRDSLSLTIRQGFDSRRSRDELNRVAEIHRSIAEAIAAKDAAKARRWMTIHFDEARDFVLKRSQKRSPKLSPKRA